MVMSDEQKANMQLKAKEARERKDQQVRDHALAVKAELSQANPGIDEDQLEKKLKYALEGEKLDSDITLAVKRLEDLQIKRYKRNNPSSIGVSIDKIKKSYDSLINWPIEPLLFLFFKTFIDCIYFISMKQKITQCRTCEYVFGVGNVIPEWCPKCLTVIHHSDTSVLTHADS